MTKEEIRKRTLALRDGLSEDYRLKASLSIQEKLLTLPEYEKAQNVFLYHSFKSEADTLYLIDETIKRKGIVFLPRVQSRIKMSFYGIRDRRELVKNGYGILEPLPAGNEEKTPGLFIIPLVAYDKEGHRIGYGGGYYDRYLVSFKGRVPIAAMAFAEQCMNGKIEPDDNDIKADIIVTQKEILRICERDGRKQTSA